LAVDAPGFAGIVDVKAEVDEPAGEGRCLLLGEEGGQIDAVEGVGLAERDIDPGETLVEGRGVAADGSGADLEGEVTAAGLAGPEGEAEGFAGVEDAVVAEGGIEGQGAEKGCFT